MKFSVLMSVYYKEKSSNLKLALDSIINQSLPPDEIILVKDGPLTKELDCLIDEYCQKYNFINVIKLEKNVGLGKALNEGLKHCKFEYVARMDSDDISLLNRFEKQLSFIEKNPDIDVVGGNIIEFDDATGENLSLKKVPEKHEEILKYAKKRNPINHPAVLFKKKSVMDSGNYADCMFFEDYYLWIRMLCSGYKMYNIQEPILRARAGLELSNRRGSIKYVKCIINFQNKLLKLKMINLFEYIYNISVRVFISILPNKIRYKFYQKKLRNKKLGDFDE